MAQLGTLLKELLEKAGVDTTQKDVIDLLSINATVPDNIHNQIKTHLDSLLTVDAAKQNASLQSYFKNQSLLPADSEIKRLLDEFGFDDTTKGEFETEKSTYKKNSLLDNKLKRKNQLRILEIKKHFRKKSIS